MCQRGRKWSILTFCLIVLMLYNLLLTAKLMYKSDCSRNVIQVQKVEAPRNKPCLNDLGEFTVTQPFSKLDFRLGRWDNSRNYKYFDNLLIGEEFAELGDKFSVCLATQSTVERLFSIAEVANQWAASISLAVFAAGDDELKILLVYIIYLRQCFANIKNKVTFHLAVPKGRMPTSNEIDINDLPNMDCTKPEITLNQLLKRRSSATEKWRNKHPYPQNHMRNLARKHCGSGYVFLTDVDVIPSNKQAELLNEFLKETDCDGKCAYVIPTYELDDRVAFPPNKSELVRLANKGLARPFHQKVFVFNQFATNFSKWQNYKSEEDKVVVSHTVTNFEFLYEPFYVAPDDVPPHDERFVGYGYTRNTQVYEMYVAGYEFFVLSPLFTCHWGLQFKRGRPHWREIQNTQNRHRFEVFKHEVFAKYGRDPLDMVSIRRRARKHQHVHNHQNE
ncbi:beta-1,4-glucuronyltransferase 1 [Onthophagus taurus]|uniref:beta-1,4-glucuronyltransferase 1 n=1 Tax=Onthophagus taurus TaxID=166361 RepID=UPI000C20959B|nr:beta-1,4-glucuronyltransferase 1 [Onthophagus taurus]